MLHESRRQALRTLSAVAASVAWGWNSLLATRVDGQTPQPMPSPNAPSNQNFPGGLNGNNQMHPDKMPVNPLLQQQIAGSVQQLFKLASELKDEVEHTNLNQTFSLTFVKKAQQIEKLAKQIRDRAKG